MKEYVILDLEWTSWRGNYFGKNLFFQKRKAWQKKEIIQIGAIKFDKNYKILKRDKVTIPKIKDEDRHIAENIQGIVKWMRLRFNDLLQSKRFEIEKVNFSAFGATLVNLDQNGEVVTPVYDYHKSIKEDIIVSFYENYGPEIVFATRTGSKNLKMLNSAKQLYWLKFAKPEFYKKIKYSLHLPQYLSYVFTGEMFSNFKSDGPVL